MTCKLEGFIRTNVDHKEYPGLYVLSENGLFFTYIAFPPVYLFSPMILMRFSSAHQGKEAERSRGETLRRSEMLALVKSAGLRNGVLML